MLQSTLEVHEVIYFLNCKTLFAPYISMSLHSSAEIAVSQDLKISGFLYDILVSSFIP